MRRILIGLMATAFATLLVISTGCSSSQSAKTPKTPDNIRAAEQSSPLSNQSNGAQGSPQRAVRQVVPLKQLYMVIETNKGRIVVQLFPHKAPKTVDSVIALVQKNFYDGIKWHRVVPGYVIQGGDPLSMNSDPSDDGFGGPGYTIKAELNDVPMLRGTVAMVHNEKSVDSGGSQFFICLNDQPQLDGKYAVIGKVVQGMDVVDKIAYYDTMTKVRILERDLSGDTEGARN